MSVGDVNSSARGSGARFNDGKPDFSLIPLRLLEGEARVWMHGERKYARNNWMKGMPWSVPLASLMRHLAAWQSGEDFDPETGEHHLDHASCNIRMLRLYADTYPEGDNRPKEWLTIPAGRALDMVSMAPPNCDGLSARDVRSPHPMQAEAIRDHDERLQGPEDAL